MFLKCDNSNAVFNIIRLYYLNKEDIAMSMIAVKTNI